MRFGNFLNKNQNVNGSLWQHGTLLYLIQCKQELYVYSKKVQISATFLVSLSSWGWTNLYSISEKNKEKKYIFIFDIPETNILIIRGQGFQIGRNNRRNSGIKQSTHNRKAYCFLLHQSTTLNLQTQTNKYKITKIKKHQTCTQNCP